MHKGNPILPHYLNYINFFKVTILFNLLVRLKFPSNYTDGVLVIAVLMSSTSQANIHIVYQFSNVLVMTQFSVLKSTGLGRIESFVLLNDLLLFWVDFTA